MTRVLLALGLAALTICVGLWTAALAARNHRRAHNLALLQRPLEMRRAANEELEAQAAAHVWGVSNGSSGIGPGSAAGAAHGPQESQP